MSFPIPYNGPAQNLRKGQRFLEALLGGPSVDESWMPNPHTGHPYPLRRTSPPEQMSPVTPQLGGAQQWTQGPVISQQKPNIFQNVARNFQQQGQATSSPSLNMDDLPVGAQAALQRETGSTSGFTGGSFSNMIQQAAQQKAAGQELPFQGMTPDEAHRSFNRQSPGGNRLTDYDTNEIYAVVRNMSPEEYAELESYTTREELADAASDTALDILEENQIYMSDALEERFKAGIGPAMEDWYQTQVAKKGMTDMTSYMMGVTQFATALIDEYGEHPDVAMGREPVSYTGSTTPGSTTVPTTSFTGQGGMPTEEEFILAVQAGQIPKEYVEGYLHFLETNPGATYEDFMTGGG